MISKALLRDPLVLCPDYIFVQIILQGSGTRQEFRCQDETTRIFLMKSPKALAASATPEPRFLIWAER